MYVKKSGEEGNVRKVVSCLFRAWRKGVSPSSLLPSPWWYHVYEGLGPFWTEGEETVQNVEGRACETNNFVGLRVTVSVDPCTNVLNRGPCVSSCLLLFLVYFRFSVFATFSWLSLSVLFLLSARRVSVQCCSSSLTGRNCARRLTCSISGAPSEDLSVVYLHYRLHGSTSRDPPSLPLFCPYLSSLSSFFPSHLSRTSSNEISPVYLPRHQLSYPVSTSSFCKISIFFNIDHNTYPTTGALIYRFRIMGHGYPYWKKP